MIETIGQSLRGSNYQDHYEALAPLTKRGLQESIAVELVVENVSKMGTEMCSDKDR